MTPATWPPLSTVASSYECDEHGVYATKGSTLKLACPTCVAECVRAESEWRAAWDRHDRWARSRIPARLRSRTLENFHPRTIEHRKIAAAAKAWTEQDPCIIDSLVLCGEVGTGKSHITCAIAAEMVRIGWRVRYITAPDLFASIKSTYDSGEREAAVLQPLLSTDLLIVDEIGATNASAWEHSKLFELVDARFRGEAATILAGNFQPAELAGLIGERLADRMAECALVLRFPPGSYRAQVRADRALIDAPEPFPAPQESLELAYTSAGVRKTKTICR